ncbi:unnamed protein product [Rhizopus stolonifer]
MYIKQSYVLSQAEEFDPQSFYIHFGFKTRSFAQDELKIAVESAYNETQDEQLKIFLYEEYIGNDFLALTDSTYLNIDWTDTIKDVISTNTQKRKLDYILSHEATKKRIITYRKR